MQSASLRGVGLFKSTDDDLKLKTATGLDGYKLPKIVICIPPHFLFRFQDIALDKIRFESLTDKSKLDPQLELFIRIVPDKVNKTLSIIDSGVGMTKSGIVRRYYSEAIDSGAAPVSLSSDRTVDVQCVIDIMEHLLACEATWHKGPLAQTVFPRIYLLKLDRTLPHPLLHSYCRVIRATCNSEEDLFTMIYGLPLKGDGDEKCLSMLYAVDEIISRQLRAYKAPP
ncbi:hypothetical protein RHSIM_Rhsim13G0106800 [Rhododendron simsii]|uniref:NAA35-like N-terminal domain-containing protein n=1 Tax=Rhododendron simsii TaxID=118357 RepID=A0A834FXM1_RHOSS|nr:hypothetical protein RHSIM_Rhsim13G0106800 [Rhododendron simsii]